LILTKIELELCELGDKMKFKLDDDEVAKVMSAMSSTTADFYDAEMVMIMFMTDRKVMKKLVPKPLKPSPVPLVSVFFAKYPRTNFGSVYNEAAMGLAVDFKGEQGSYCLTMPVTEDMALILGREIYGYPKKIADEISLNKTKDGLNCRYVRRGTELLKLSMPFEKEMDSKELVEMLGRLTMQELDKEEWDVSSFNFKYFPSPTLTGFDYKPRLIKQVTTFRPVGKMQVSETFELDLKSSEVDQLGIIPFSKPLIGFYGIFNNSMHAGEVVAEADEEKFMPYAYSKVDYMPQ